MTYQEACLQLGREVILPSTLTGSRPAKPHWEPRVTAAPGDIWQAKARKLVDEGVYHLWTPTGYPMLDFFFPEARADRRNHPRIFPWSDSPEQMGGGEGMGSG